MDQAPQPQLQPVVPAPAPLAPSVQAAGTVPLPGAQSATVTKVIVAVHGIGDQQTYATIQAVVNQFCHFYRQPAAIPLGTFHTGAAALTVAPPFPEQPFGQYAFAEVYWAKIPRSMVADQHTIEEAKQWARTIIQRLRMRWRASGSQGGAQEPDFRLADQVVGELIETIAVSERLCYIANKAGVFTFDLRKLLDDYLGDVQIVTEFKQQRDQILTAFDDVMARVHAGFPQADIHIVAHSEGTVVSFLGLLRAFRQQNRPAWADRVRGFMTLGSPIDKHLALWPELFGAGGPATPKANADPRIEWRNYYDFGDPVGFALDDARAWLKANNWNSVFSFAEKDHDNGFARYPFPGKAHVDYWTDESVFGHYIATVIREQPPAAAPAPSFQKPPRNIRGRQLLSYVVPYLGVAVLLLIGSFVLFKAVYGALEMPGKTLNVMTIARAVVGIAALVFGVTAVARVPRLTRSMLWRGLAGLGGAAGAAIYLWSVSRWSLLRISADDSLTGLPMIILAAVLIAVVYFISSGRPDWGAKPLIFIGAAFVTFIVGYHVFTAKDVGYLGPIWPVFIATVAFLYLWWLAALLFDLFFVWHLYIRHARMLIRMDEIMNCGVRREPRPSWSRKSAPSVSH